MFLPGYFLEKQSNIFPRNLQKNVTICVYPNCVLIPVEEGKAVSFHKVPVLHGQGDTNNWVTVNKMKGERILSNPLWQILVSGRLCAFAKDNGRHPGFCYCPWELAWSREISVTEVFPSKLST